MAQFIRIPTPIKADRLTRVMQIRGTDVYVHWSVFLVAALMLSAVVRRPLVTLAGLAGWFGVMLIHECGHAFAAQRYGCGVQAIDLYPIFGVTRLETPWSKFADCVIAWGGVLAQAVIAIPIVVFLAQHGYSTLEPVNALLALLGPYSAMVAVVNLLPFRPLDGARAWKLLPSLFEARRRSGGRTMRNARWR
jgi:stage IV sporulation protein FB